MIALVAHADIEGCGFYRLICPSTVLKAQGLDVTLDLGGKSTRGIVVDDHVVGMETPECDVFVVQRPTTTEALSAIPLLQAQGIAVVVEIDDDFWSLTPKHEGYKRLHPDHNPYSNHRNLEEACRMADVVTVSTPELAKLVPNKNVAVLRNCIPAYYLELERPEYRFDKLVVGWTGTPETHLGDLQVMGDSLRRVVRANDAQFMTIGSEETSEVLGFEPDETSWSPWVELRNYVPSIKIFDLGIVPLRMSRFNDCKSYLKGLEYSSQGIPFVASPSAEYRYLAEKGVGVLAKYKQDWYRLLNKFLTDSDYRESAAMLGKEFAREQTYEQNAWRWAEQWERAIRIRALSPRVKA